MFDEDMVLLSLINKTREEIKKSIYEKIAEVKEEIDKELDEIHKRYRIIKHFEKNNNEKEEKEEIEKY